MDRMKPQPEVSRPADTKPVPSTLCIIADLFDALMKMPGAGGYDFTYSYKPSKAAKTHVVNERFRPDFFIKLAVKKEILVVEIKADGDDSNRNRAKCRDGAKHFATLNDRLKESGEPWRYHFYFLSPDDYSYFFQAIRDGTHSGWASGLMQKLKLEQTPA